MALAGAVVVVRVWNARRHRRARRFGTNVTMYRPRPSSPCWLGSVARSAWLPGGAHSFLRISLALRDSYAAAAMSEQRDRVVAVGEAIVELVRGGDGRFGIGCAGD